MNISNIKNLDFLFTKEFQNIDINIVVKELSEKGYFSFPNAFTKAAVNAIENDSTKSKLNFGTIQSDIKRKQSIN